jgi:hypothetical protein
MNTRDFWFNQPHAKSELDHRAAEAVDKIDNMSAETERPIAARSSSRNVAIRFLPGRHKSRSRAFWIFALAIVAALWAFGYKLTRYTPRLDPATRVSFVKLWDKHQDVAQLTPALEASTQSYFDSPLDTHLGRCLMYRALDPQTRMSWRNADLHPARGPSFLFDLLHRRRSRAISARREFGRTRECVCC